MATRVVVLDACVLYGIEVTDLVLTMATRHLFRPHWSPQILHEVTRNLKLRDDLHPAAIDRRIGYMNRALPSALDEAPATLIDAMPVNEKDRHVLALAVHVEAPMIVTENLRDFPPAHLERFDIDAVSVDTFVLAHIERDPAAVVGAIDAMAARRRRHPKTRDDIIEVLRRQLARSMAALAT
jgi:hypothetical protein